MLISDKLKSENFCTVLSILYSLAFFLEGKEKKKKDNNIIIHKVEDCNSLK